MIANNDQIAPVVAHGKFFSRRGQKFFFKAVRLASFNGSHDFSEHIALQQRLSDLRAGYTNAVLISESQAETSLDLIAQGGLCALVELDLQFQDLLSVRKLRSAVARIVERVKSLRNYPGIIGYLLDCHVDPELARYHGLQWLRARLARLVDAVRRADAGKLVALKHWPAMAGFILQQEDLVYTALPPLTTSELCSTVVRLHNLAEARPLILEIPEELPEQDQFIAAAFGLGAAGVVASPIAAGRWSRSLGLNSLSIKTLDRGEILPFIALNGSCPPLPSRTPMVSVVICAYNAERTMRPCLESLRQLDYPNFEVVIVDDGSRDSTAEIAAEYPEFRLIRQPNKGLSTARNVGLHAALGEIVAYTDSDCVVDPHWLTLMVRAMVEGRLDGCGGPNYAPHEDGRVEACVAASPGAPCHVLLGDDRAEHLAGCNMIYRKAALVEIGGFDPQFTAAGDDVDICWRLIDAGYTLGYCPPAFVWHFRRNTIKAYYGQQRGYGKAEALLYFKYPDRFNSLGQIKWNGIIPGLGRTFPGGKRVRATWTRSGNQFQRVYEAPLSIAKVAPLTAEWTLGAIILLVAAIAFGITTLPAVAALAAGPLWALYYAWNAPLEKSHQGIMARLLIAWLAYTGPLSRAIARYRSRLSARRRPGLETPARQRPLIDWTRRRFRLAYWNDNYTTREVLLEQISRRLTNLGQAVVPDPGWHDFDLLVKPDFWSRIEIKTADEELGGMNLRTNIAARARLSLGAWSMIAFCAAGAAAGAIAGAAIVAAVFGMAVIGVGIAALSQMLESCRLGYRIIEQCAGELNLVPLGKPTRSTKPANVAATETDTAPEAQPAGR